MGLDMYLCAVKRKEVAYWRKANAIHEWFNCKYKEACRGEELDNCQEFYVTREDLVELKETCAKVLDSSKLEYKEVCLGERYNNATKEFEKVYGPGKVLEDTSVAEELLPTKSGFFYGSTQYGENYVEDLKSTISQINTILETTDPEEYDGFVYYGWW